ncbi:MAG: 2Fe-2S iron-sulfur cluster-binding protein [Desulfovermiculus sp.]
MSIKTPINYRVHPLGLNVQAVKGLTVGQALQESGIHVESPCDGNGVCGRCKIRVHPAQAAPETPHANISPQEAEEGVRLACQAVPEQDLEVFLPPTYRLEAESSSRDGPVLIASSRPEGHIQPAVQVMGGGWKLPAQASRGTRSGADPV